MKLTPEASMRMSAWPGPGVGVGRSRRVRTSAEPVVRIWMACMWMSGYNTAAISVEAGYSARVNYRTRSIVKLADCFVHLKSRYQISAVADFRSASVFVDYFKS